MFAIRCSVCLVLAAALTPATAAEGRHPNGWRGDTSGCWPDAEVPVEWDGPSGRNIRWKVRLPTCGSNGQPVFGPGRVLVLSEPDIVQCFATADGSLLWEDRFSAIDVDVPAAERAAMREKLFRGWCAYWGYDPADTTQARERDRHNELLREVCSRTGYRPPVSKSYHEIAWTAPTPAATAERVVVRHCSDVIACYDWEGKRLWIARPADNAVWNHESDGWGREKVLHEYGNVHIVPGEAGGPDLVICRFKPDHAHLGISEEDYRERRFFAKPGEHPHSIDALVAFDLATGRVVWRSAGLRNSNTVCGNTSQVRVGGETVIVSPGGCVVRARDGEVVLRDLGWGGHGNAAGVRSDPSGVADVVFNMGGRRQTFQSGHHVRAWRISRQGDAYRAEKLWEWGYEGPAGVTVCSPVIDGGRIFLGGKQGYVFDLAAGTPLIALPDADVARYNAWTREWLARWRQEHGEEPYDKLALHGWFWKKRKEGRSRGRGPIPRELTQHPYFDPIAAGGRLYLVHEDGSVVVLSTTLEPTAPKRAGWPAWKPRVLARNRLWPEATRAGRSDTDRAAMARWTIATPQVWGDRLYIRQNGWLWCIGEGR